MSIFLNISTHLEPPNTRTMCNRIHGHMWLGLCWMMPEHKYYYRDIEIKYEPEHEAYSCYWMGMNVGIYFDPEMNPLPDVADYKILTDFIRWIQRGAHV